VHGKTVKARAKREQWVAAGAAGGVPAMAEGGATVAVWMGLSARALQVRDSLPETH
jgi:hypothetical protein